jgi:hypothetical protein
LSHKPCWWRICLPIAPLRGALCNGNCVSTAISTLRGDLIFKGLISKKQFKVDIKPSPNFPFR